jgi:hypothetical protein
MNIFKRILITLISTLPVLLVGCSEDGFEAFQDTTTANVTTNPGVISQKHFSLKASDLFPAVVDTSNNTYTETEVTLTARIGDRNNLSITNPHTIEFRTEYGLINPGSCETDENGTCSVTWIADASPFNAELGPGYLVTITAGAIGEEAFTDTNGNSTFDDGETFEDLEEPYIDANENDIFDAGDTIIDVPSINDPTGINGAHDIGDGFFNGGGCTHSSQCGAPIIAVWDDVTLKIDGPSTTP